MSNIKSFVDDDEEGVSILDHLKLDEQHLIMFWSLMSWLVNCSKIVGSTDITKGTAPIIFQMTMLASHPMSREQLFVASNVIDASRSNWKSLLAKSTYFSKDFLRQDQMKSYPAIDFETKFIIIDFCMGWPMTNTPYLLHLTKNIVMTLEKSLTVYVTHILHRVLK